MALGPDWAFETGNLGRLTRRVPASQVVCAIPPPRRKTKPDGLSKSLTSPQKRRGSSAAKFLRLAQEWQRQLDAGEVESQAAIARREGLTRARVCQIMSLLRLAPPIQDRVLGDDASFTEHAVRAVAQIPNRQEQMRALAQTAKADTP